MISTQPSRPTSVFIVGLALGALSLLVFPATGNAYSGGPPDGKTGAPGEGTCHDCHGSFPLNSGDGLLNIDVPPVFEPGETYAITVTLADDGQIRWGFEITPLGVGSCTITDPTNTQLSISGGNSYVKQTSAGTHNGSAGPVSWSFDWTAPVDAPAEVVFYAAGNAANGNGGTSGDYIYTTLEAVASSAVEDEMPALRISPSLETAPNPFRYSTVIACYLPRDAQVVLEVFDVNGGLVQQLATGDLPAGVHHVTWHGTDHRGRAVPGGVYLCRLMTVEQTVSQRVVVLR